MSRMTDRLRFTDRGYSSQAKLYFPNGLGVSVIFGQTARSDECHPYEVCMIEKDMPPNMAVAEPIGYLTLDDVEAYIKQVAGELPQ